MSDQHLPPPPGSPPPPPVTWDQQRALKKQAKAEAKAAKAEAKNAERAQPAKPAVDELGADDQPEEVTDKSRVKLLANLQVALHEGETVDDLTTGRIKVERMGTVTTRTGTVAVTNQRVVLFSKKLGGYDVQDYQFKMLTSIDHKVGITAGNIDLAASGDHSRISLVPKKDVQRIAGLIRERVQAAHAGQTPAAVPTTKSPADQVRELAALRDEGLMTDEEFDAKRREILGL